MAADLTLTIDEAALKDSSLQLVRDAYRRALRGKVCRVHGREARISEPDASGEFNLTGCCDAFVREARIVLTNKNEVTRRVRTLASRSGTGELR